MRRFIVITLILLVTAGPGLCCCTLPRVESEATEVPSCCHAPAEHEPAPCQEQCPCREYRETPATLAKVTPISLVTSLNEFVAWDVLAVSTTVVLVSIDATGLPPPFLSTERLLHVHHRLRC